MKKITSLLLVLSMVFSMSTMQVSATDQSEATVTENEITVYAAGPTMKSERYANWFDRLANVPEKVKEFYVWLEANATATGALATLTGENISTVYYQMNMQYPDQSIVTKNYISTVYKVAEFSSTNESDITVASEGLDEYIMAAVQAFDRDHPEVFWLTGESKILTLDGYKTDGSGTATYTKTVYYELNTVDKDNGGVDFDIRSNEYRDASKIATAITNRDNNVTNILNTVTGMTRYEKVKQLNLWLTHNNCYNRYVAADVNANVNVEAHKCISALGSMTELSAPVCEGYARAFKVLCDKLEIPCVLVSGNATNSTRTEAHMWNYVQMDDGNWYAVDVTWNDPTVSGVINNVSGSEREEYLLVGGSTEIGGVTFANSHTVSNVVGTAEDSLAFTNEPVLAETAYKNYLAGYNLTLNDKIGVNFHMNLTEEQAKTSKMVFKWNNGIVTDTEPNIVEGRYVYSCDMVAKEMADTITATFYLNGIDKYMEYTYSIKEYAKTIIDNAGTNSTYTDALPLIKAMLNYGAAAQEYFGYNTDNLANMVLSEADKGMNTVRKDDLLNYKYVTNGTLPAGITSFYSSSLLLEADTKIRHYFEAESLDGIKFSLKTGTNEWKELSVKSKGNYYYVEIEEIMAADIDEMYILQVADSSSAYEIQYGVLSYIFSMLNKDTVDSNLKQVVNGLYGYYKEAENYMTQGEAES